MPQRCSFCLLPLDTTFYKRAGRRFCCPGCADRAGQLAAAARTVQLKDDGLVRALVNALDARDHYTQGHSQRVSHYSVEIGRQLGLDGEPLRTLERAAMLHDIGKIGVPDHVLCKPGPLDRQDWAWMRRHPTIGEQVFAGLPEMDDVRSAIRTHHERFDGTGYPSGLSGQSIPLLARIIAVADGLDAMTSDRAYRPARPFHKATEEIRVQSGRQFDPVTVAALLAVRPAIEELAATLPRPAQCAPDRTEPVASPPLAS